MLQKEFLRNDKISNNKIDQKVRIVVNVFFYLGVLLSVLCLGYMIVNLSKADKIISIWLPFMIAGPMIVFLSQLIKWQYTSEETKRSRTFKI